MEGVDPFMAILIENEAVLRQRLKHLENLRIEHVYRIHILENQVRELEMRLAEEQKSKSSRRGYEFL